MIVFLSILISITLVISLAFSQITIKWQKNQKENFFGKSILEESYYFILLIPAYGEQKVIKSSIEHIRNFRYNPEKFEIIIALSQLEEENISECSTRKIVEDLILENNQVPIINYYVCPKSTKGRAVQLNYALQQRLLYFNSIGRDLSEIFVGVYDADSKPDLLTLKYINYYLVNDNTCESFQQLIDYRLNYLDIENNILKGNCYYQTSWNIVLELPIFLIHNKLIEKKIPSLFPPYCMGHGEFIKLSLLQRINFFSELGFADGIQLGFILANEKIKIIPIPFADKCESPNNIRSLIHQHSFWFAGNMEAFKYIRVNHDKIVIKIVQFLYHVSLIVTWALKPLPLVLLLIFCLHSLKSLGNNELLSLFIVTLTIVTYGFLMIRFINQVYDVIPIKSRSMGKRVINFFLAFVIKSIGPWIYIYKVLNNIFFARRISFKKMKRE